MSGGLKVEFVDNSASQYDENAAEVRVDKRSVGKLYIGDRFAAAFVQIKARNISNIVCCSEDLNGFCKEPDVKYCKYDPSEQAMDQCSKPIEFTTNALKSNKNVLIFCESGRGKSAAVLMYYLMKSKRYSLKESLRVVEDARGKCKIPPSLCKLLLQMEKETFDKNSMLIIDGKLINFPSSMTSSNKFGKNAADPTCNLLYPLGIAGVFVAVLSALAAYSYHF